MPACVHRDQQDVETGICCWLLWFYWMLYLFFFFFFYILILQSPQLPYIYISVWEVECVAFILRPDGDISFKVKTCFISTGYGINGQRSVYLCLFEGVLTLYCAHTHICLSPCQIQRDSGKTLSSSFLRQPETIFIQLLSYPAWGTQCWHLQTLASLQDRPKKSVFSDLYNGET